MLSGVPDVDGVPVGDPVFDGVEEVVTLGVPVSLDVLVLDVVLVGEELVLAVNEAVLVELGGAVSVGEMDTVGVTVCDGVDVGLAVEADVCDALALAVRLAVFVFDEVTLRLARERWGTSGRTSTGRCRRGSNTRSSTHTRRARR